MLVSTSKNANGTSFHNSTVTATVNDLIFIIGEPTYDDNTGQDKVNIEWVLEDENGNVVTIYDWKEYRKIGMDEKIVWHIGGMSKEITNNAKEEIELVMSYKTSSMFI
jgi:hypothetical protein